MAQIVPRPPKRGLVGQRLPGSSLNFAWNPKILPWKNRTIPPILIRTWIECSTKEWILMTSMLVRVRTAKSGGWFCQYHQPLWLWRWYQIWPPDCGCQVHTGCSLSRNFTHRGIGPSYWRGRMQGFEEENRKVYCIGMLFRLESWDGQKPGQSAATAFVYILQLYFLP